MSKADETIRYALACRAPLTAKMINDAPVPDFIKDADEKYSELHRIELQLKDKAQLASKEFIAKNKKHAIENAEFRLNEKFTAIHIAALLCFNISKYLRYRNFEAIASIEQDGWGSQRKYRKAVAALNFADEMLGTSRESMILTLKPDSDLTHAILRFSYYEDEAKKYIAGHDSRMSALEDDYNNVMHILNNASKPITEGEKVKSDYDPMYVSMPSDKLDFWGWLGKKFF